MRGATRPARFCRRSAFLGNQPFRRFILDEGLSLQPVVQAALGRGSCASSDQYGCNAASCQKSCIIGLRGLASAEGQPRPTGCFKRRYLELLAQGHSNKEIGRVMGVSINTVKYHLKQIYGELHVDNRARAVNQAGNLGIIDD